jgi:hypothetical protein
MEEDHLKTKKNGNFRTFSCPKHMAPTKEAKSLHHAPQHDPRLMVPSNFAFWLVFQGGPSKEKPISLVLNLLINIDPCKHFYHLET